MRARPARCARVRGGAQVPERLAAPSLLASPAAPLGYCEALCLAHPALEVLKQLPLLVCVIVPVVQRHEAGAEALELVV
jgi:hypothetical protein